MILSSAAAVLDDTCGLDFSVGVWSSLRYHSLSFLANSFSALLALNLYHMLTNHNTFWCAATLWATVNTLRQFCFMPLGWMITRWIKSSFPFPLPLLHYQSPLLSYSLLPQPFSCLLLSSYSSFSIFQWSPAQEKEAHKCAWNYVWEIGSFWVRRLSEGEL